MQSIKKDSNRMELNEKTSSYIASFPLLNYRGNLFSISFLLQLIFSSAILNSVLQSLFIDLLT